MTVTPNDLLSADLPHAFRGFDEKATTDLIEAAARALRHALNERDELRAKVEELETQSQPPLPATADQAGSRRPAGSPEELEQIGAALITAHRAAERLLQEAKQEAASLTEAARADAKRIRREAEQAAADIRSDANAQTDALRAQDAALLETIENHRTELARLLRRALDQLLASTTAESAAPAALPDELRDELRDRVARSDGDRTSASWTDIGRSPSGRPS